jgi:hypothetical protein
MNWQNRPRSCKLKPLMTQRVGRLFVPGVCVIACILAAAMSLWLPDDGAQTEDRNGDGRPDVWRLYDHQHRLTDVTTDTNFDGRSDVHEYFALGTLVRRESDRDFNDHVDLVQEFDASTHEHVRSLVDVDFDGTADLLVLFQAGRPVFSKWAPPVAAALVPVDFPRAALGRERQLVPLQDPFSDDLAVRALGVVAGSDCCAGLATSGGMPASGTAIASLFPLGAGASGLNVALPPSASVAQYSPRGPPSSPLLS